MPWPDIFFKAKKPKPDPNAPPPFPSTAEGVQPPTVKPVPTAATSSTTAIPRPQVKINTPDTGTRTLPAMHGVILRPPARLNTTTQITPQSAPPSEPIKNIEELMAEADPMRTLSQTGNVRLLKRQAPETTELPPLPTLPTAPAIPPTEPSAIKPDPALPGSSISTAFPNAPTTSLPPALPVAVERRPLPIPAPSAFSTTRSIHPPRPVGAPSILKPTVSLASNVTRRLPGSTPPAMIPLAVVRRKASMSDVARIILPPRRDETEPLPAPPVPVPTVIPPSFSVTGEPPRLLTEEAPIAMPTISESLTVPAALAETPFLKKSEPKSAGIESPAPEIKNEFPPVAEKLPEIVSLFPDLPKVDPEAHKSEAPVDLPKLDPEAHKESTFVPPAFEDSTPPITLLFTDTPAPTPPVVTEPLPETMSLFVDPPKVDPGAHKPDLSSAPEPKVDPEAHKETPFIAPAPEPEKPVEPEPVISQAPPPGATPSMEIAPAPAAREKREFHLTNGEKVAGVVLSESPEAIYIEHATLGVVTVPRNEIAKRLVEIILINGDRIVGDIMAETADMIYVRHASLGMLSVPRAQRSTRVVEAILDNGDRILGEVLTETDTFTVIKSATLGTVTLPHNKISMLNRKIEQIQLKALPMSESVPALSDKSYPPS